MPERGLDRRRENAPKRPECIGLALVLGLVGFGVPTARAEDGTPTARAEDGTPTPGDVELLVAGEVIEVWSERPDKPFDRDTEERLTGKELAERGATNLADALALIPELNVRAAGRGGRQIDIRGARKGSIKVLIDGVPVDDPYYGNFDISSIPITDIVQIRVSTSPSSPIDGAGGPGGVVEVHTRDAVGKRMIAARVQAGTLPSALASATARTMLTRSLALRVSASSTLGSRDFEISMPEGRMMSLAEDRRGLHGALRLEYRRGDRRVVTDVTAQHRGYVVPPGEDGASDVLVIDGERSARVGVTADDRIGKLALQLRGHAQALTRDSLVYDDPTLTMMVRKENLAATRAGLAFLARRPLGKRFHLIGATTFDSERADVENFDGAPSGGRASIATLSGGLQFEQGRFRLDSAAGLAVPIGLGADPWPELKLSASYSFDPALTLEATGAHKGRTPTLRERFRADIGNRALGPEHASFGELSVMVKPAAAVQLTVAGYLRRTNGMIRYDPGQTRLVNTGELEIRGVDARLKLSPASTLSAGLDWSFADAYSPAMGTDPLDHFPANRSQLWISARSRRIGATAWARRIGARLDRGATLPAYTTLSISAFAHLTESIMATLRLDNLSDERFEIRHQVRDPGRALVLTALGQW